MFAKITAVVALLLGLGASASAQSTDDILRGGFSNGTTGDTGSVGVSGEGSDTGSVPAAWGGEIAAAFFSDPGAGTLRPQEQVRSNWTRLSAQQQADVREYCATAEIAQADPDGGDDSQVTTGSTASGADAGDGEEATERLTVTRASMIRLCNWIEEM